MQAVSSFINKALRLVYTGEQHLSTTQTYSPLPEQTPALCSRIDNIHSRQVLFSCMVTSVSNNLSRLTMLATITCKKMHVMQTRSNDPIGRASAGGSVTWF